MNKRAPRPFSRLAIVVASLIGVAGASAGLIYLQHIQLPKRLSEVDPGVLYRSAQPKIAQIDNTIEEFGVKTLVIVREGESRAVPDEKEHAQSQGLRVIHIPVESRKPVPDEHVKRFFEIVDDPANRPVWVHCSAGRHRTGYLCALYRIERMGWSVEEATAEMISFGFDKADQSPVLDQLKAYRPGRWKKTATTSPSDQ
ncbi:MAG TPA: tyrosine-protein phosphatase [Phycisphaerae bacterium]|nr:tyrosine-protein phosphatase [Phycisphaerae bacterium]